MRAVVTLPATEPTASDGHVELAALGHLPLLLFADDDSVGFAATALAGCRVAGFEPAITWIPRGEAKEAFRRSSGFTFPALGARVRAGRM